MPPLNPLFATLPQALLRCIGHWCAPWQLAQAWHAALSPAQAPPAPDSRVPQALAERLQRTPDLQCCWRSGGLDALLHRRPPSAHTVAPQVPQPPHWGLHALCLHTGAAGGPAWSGPWPGGMDLQAMRSLRPEALAQHLAQAPEEAVIAPGMVCATVQGHADSLWSLLGLYGPANAQLHTLVLGRLGEWVDASPLPAPAEAPRPA